MEFTPNNHKFRAKRLDNRKYIVGFPLFHAPGHVTIHDYGCPVGDKGVEVLESSLRQYWGLDHLSNELYCGDKATVTHGEKVFTHILTIANKERIRNDLDKFGGIFEKI